MLVFEVIGYGFPFFSAAYLRVCNLVVLGVFGLFRSTPECRDSSFGVGFRGFNFGCVRWFRVLVFEFLGFNVGLFWVGVVYIRELTFGQLKQRIDFKGVNL